MLSCAGLAALAGSGCLVAEAPEYGAAVQTTPLIDTQKVVPEVYRVFETTRTARTPFTIPVRSEDAGEELVAAFVLNFGTNAERYLEDFRFAPATYDQERSLTMSLQLSDVPVGCSQLTLFVSHLSKVDTNANEILERTGGSTVTWWLNVASDDGTPGPSTCPTSTPTVMGE